MKSWRAELNRNAAVEMHNNNPIHLPEPVAKWLAELSLLYDIPFPYLVPDEKLLPPEAIRFFHIDPNWISALANGALSIGRNTSEDVASDSRNVMAFRNNRYSQLRSPRWERMHKRHRRIQAQPMNSSNAMSGFLIRSALVAHWKGIEVKGFQGKVPLNILRMQPLSKDILICIFDGVVTNIQILEPVEQLHFGTRGNDRKINIRIIDEAHIGELSGKTAIVKSDQYGRIDVCGLAKEIEGALNREIGSAELAFQMISVAGQCEFCSGSDAIALNVKDNLL